LIEQAMSPDVKDVVSMDPSFGTSTRISELVITKKSFNNNEEEKFDLSMQIDNMLIDHSHYDE